MPVVSSSDRRRVEYILIPRRTGPPDQEHGFFGFSHNDVYHFAGITVSAKEYFSTWGAFIVSAYSNRFGSVYRLIASFTAIGGL